ncbi:MAG: trehalose-phosphatase [Rhodospirillales bacterium]
MLSTLPSAFDRLDQIAARLKDKKPAIFLDYDGTLTPIADRPELAVLDSAMRDLISRLAGNYTIAIVSGRDRLDVKELVGLENIIYAGSHGFDIAGPDGVSIRRQEGAEFKGELKKAEKALRHELDSLKGALVEPKKASVAAHFRQVEENERPRIKAAVDAILDGHPELRATPGKMVYDIQPRLEWDKGKAVLYIIETMDLNRPDVAAVYFGDDITDEDAFKAIAEKGIGIFAGDITVLAEDRPTAADYYVKNVDEVGRLLQLLFDS